MESQPRSHSAGFLAAAAALALLLAGCAAVYQRLYPTVRVEIANSSAMEVTGLYVGDASEPAEWGDNLLGEPVPSGGTASVEGVARGTVWVLVVLADGTERLLSEIDLSERDVLAITVE